MTHENTAPAAPGPDAGQLDESQIAQRPFECRDPEFRVVIEPAAFENIIAHGQTNVEIELCGVLVGNLHRDDNGPYLLVSGAIRGREAREESSQVTFTHSAWENIHKELDEKHAGRQIVGWYHMHPGYGIFLSEADLFVHRHFFNAAYQVALVVDPKAAQQGVFFWEKGEVVRARRYWVGQRLCWEPAERLATQVPPGISHGTAEEKRRPAADDDRERGESPPSGWNWLGVPLLVALGLMCLILGYGNVDGILRNYRLVSDMRTLQDKANEIAEKATDAQKKVAADVRAENRRLAGPLALWLRQRLDAGEEPTKLQPLYDEVLRLDKDGRATYERLLPELAPKPKPAAKTAESKPPEPKP
jgi:proteasome lid subunit RPN8/RPN11